MGRHTPLTDVQRAAVAEKAVEQVADTLVEMHPLSDDDTSGYRT